MFRRCGFTMTQFAMSNESRHSGTVGKAVARGAAWTLSIRLVSRSLGLVSTLILARLLTPTDFGIYALAMTVYAFVELLRAFGFGSALIQNPDTTAAHYHTAWTLHFLFSLATACVLFLLAPLAAGFLNEPKLEIVVRFMSLLFLIDGVKNIGIIDFQKYMTFDREFRLTLTVKLTGFALTVPLAFILKSYWAMLWGLLGSALMLTVLSYVMQPFRPRFDLSRWRSLISFSTWILVNNILNYFNRHTENILVSRMAGIAAVGSLQLARETGQLLSEVAQPINRAAFPGYSSVNKSPDRVLNLFCEVVGLLIMVGFPVALGIFAIAHLFVPTVLGPKWLDIVPLMQWLALASLMMVTMTSVNGVLIALARMKWATGIIAFRLILLVCFLFYYLPLYGVLGVAYAAVTTMAFVLVLSYVALRLNLKLGLRRVAYILYKPAIASAVMLIILKMLFPLHWAQSPISLQILQLIAATLTGAISYSLVLGILWFFESRPEGPELNLLRLLHNRTGLFVFLIPERSRGG